MLRKGQRVLRDDVPGELGRFRRGIGHQRDDIAEADHGFRQHFYFHGDALNGERGCVRRMAMKNGADIRSCAVDCKMQNELTKRLTAAAYFFSVGINHQQSFLRNPRFGKGCGCGEDALRIEARCGVAVVICNPAALVHAMADVDQFAL